MTSEKTGQSQSPELTQEEVWKEAFGLFDKNKDGTISLAELDKLMQSLNLNPTQQEVKEAAKHLDKDGNGTCDFNDFCKLMQEKSRSPSEYENDMRNAFRVFDVDGNNYIEKEELVFILCRLGEPLSESELEIAMKYLDTDGDGRINYEEFTKMCNSPL